MSNDLTTTTSALPALPEAARIREVFEANFEGQVPAFPVIKMPTGGMTVWALPSADGEDDDVVKELVGVVLDHYSTRTFWRGAYTAGKSQPDCFSTDLKTGSQPRNEDGEFGECSSCKWSKFGTKIKASGGTGRGQACSLKRRVFLLMPDRETIFPFMVALSVTSSTKKYPGSFATYTVDLAGKLKKITEVTTRIKLIPGGEDEDGNKYSAAAFYRVADLTPEEIAKVEVLRNMLKPAMRNRPIDMDEVETTNGNGGGSADGADDPWNKK